MWKSSAFTYNHGKCVFGIEQFRPQRKLLLEKIEQNASERFAEVLSVGTDVDATSDNCTCCQINYLQLVTFQHLNGFLIRNDLV